MVFAQPGTFGFRHVAAVAWIAGFPFSTLGCRQGFRETRRTFAYKSGHASFPLSLFAWIPALDTRAGYTRRIPAPWLMSRSIHGGECSARVTAREETPCILALHPAFRGCILRARELQPLGSLLMPCYAETGGYAARCIRLCCVSTDGISATPRQQAELTWHACLTASL